MWQKILHIIKNKYFITLLAFSVWITFFDRNNLLRRYELNQNLEQLKTEQNYYRTQITDDSLALHHLLSDTQDLIRFGREKYYLKKDNEVIFLIIPPKE